MVKISWGIIGCGDVTEVKSGPAFNKVSNSSLYAVMRRDISRAADYAKRHNVPVYYNDASSLINDPNVNAIYIATPPDSHELYAIQTIEAGKVVYVEKPMAFNYTASLRLQSAVEKYDAKLCVAHYRNAQPFYKSIKQLVDESAIGLPQTVEINFCRKALTPDDLQQPQKSWRMNASISGGGLFHDLAPHQLATMLQLFGKVKSVSGRASNQSNHYSVDDHVEGTIEFLNGTLFKGVWNFNADSDTDDCVIIGTEGKIQFSFFGKQQWKLTKGVQTQLQQFEPPQHVQQPMIEKVVQYFLGKTPNPCPVEEGVEVMRLMEAMTGS